jgi:methionyl-tRNA formyltransferase
MKLLRIGYFADGPWSHLALKKLLTDKTIKVQFICVRSDKPDEILRKIAIENSINLFCHPNINSKEFINLVSGFPCELFISMSFNQIFKKTMIDMPSLGAINCHAGKLPFYRGRNVLNWVLINDEKEFGITVHFIDEGIDTGNIILQRTYEISDVDNYATLLNRAYEGCSAILYDAIKLIQAGAVITLNQLSIHPLGSYCIARIEGDENLDWRQTSRDIFNFVRAICHPGPQAHTYLHNKEVMINRVILLPNATNFKGIPGSVIGVSDGSFLVKTMDSFIEVTDWSGYLNPRVGDRFK